MDTDRLTVITSCLLIREPDSHCLSFGTPDGSLRRCISTAPDAVPGAAVPAGSKHRFSAVYLPFLYPSISGELEISMLS